MSQNTPRPARQEEAGALAAIDAEVSVNPWSERQFAAACAGADSKHEVTLVLAQQDRIDGFIVFSQVLDEATIHNFAVRPMLQGRGFGQRLLDAALQQVKLAGAFRVLLEVRESNTAARRLYEVNGFGLDGVRKNYYPTNDGRENALLMSRKL